MSWFPDFRSASNPLMAELLKQGKLLASSTRVTEDSGPADNDDDEETEAGEIREDEATAETATGAAGRKRKHSPIVWQPGGSKAARPAADVGAGSLGLLERAQQEAAALKDMQHDLDPDAPAAMKRSPVLSDEGGVLALSALLCFAWHCLAVCAHVCWVHAVCAGNVVTSLCALVFTPVCKHAF